MFASSQGWRLHFGVQSCLQGKIATQTVKGGNTEEFYHKKNAEHINEGTL